jgi:nickel/cobalt exporter
MIGVDAPGGLLAGAILLGLVHGVEPGHGWPVAAAYAMDRSNAWAAGFAASLLIGIGHLVSSIAVVFAYFYAIAYFDLTQLDEPVVIAGVAIGGPLGIVAGVLLIGLGIREYYGGGHGHDHSGDHGHAHGDGPGHDRDEHGDHEHEDHDHDDPQHSHHHDHGHHPDHGHHQHGHEHADSGTTVQDSPRDSGWRGRIRSALPFAGGGHEHLEKSTAQHQGLLGIAWVAFVLGFAHEEEFEIIALCTGSTHCLELMLVYATTVVLGIVALTMGLVAGYQHFEERVERITPYLPLVSAAVLILMGVGFLLGLL